MLVCYVGIKTTNYKDSDDMIRDRIVMGVSSKEVREKLLRESDLTLTKAITFCRAVEVSRTQVKVLENEQELSLNAVQRRTKFNYKSAETHSCQYCGFVHQKGKCVAFGKQCKKCLKMNHFASVCMQVKKQSNVSDNKKVHNVREEQQPDDDDQFFVSAITKQVRWLKSNGSPSCEKNWMETVNVQGQQVQFKLDTGAEPIRRIPQALYSRVKEKLVQLEKDGIITKQDKPTEWLNPLVIVEKSNGDLRLCLDPKYLNEAISREHFLIPTVEEIASKLSKKSYFTVLDMKDGYFQVRITDESSEYCSFGTPFGRYRFLRLPFGIKSAPEVFQKKNYEVFGDIDGVGIYFDDLIITGTTEQEHDEKLRLVLERAKKFNIKFNRNKIQFKSRQVKFMGQLFTEKGIERCESYVRAIHEMSKPQQRNDVLRFLGMAKYLGKFIPNLSKISAPLRQLTRTDVEWIWTDEHDKALTQIKHLLANAPVLAFFDSSLGVVIETDASKDGLDACLLQNGHPVAFCSRSLTNSEIKYAQIEKEMLAIDFACQKFHYLIYGVQNISINTDHKPLVSIFKKDLYVVTPRLQRLRLRLLKYDLDVSYKPGKYLYIADTLSRAYLVTPGYDDPDLEYAIHTLVNYLPVSDEIKSLLTQGTQRDSDLSMVMGYINCGWPEKDKIPINLRQYFKIKDDLIICDKLLFFGNKLIIPSDCRSLMIQKMHERHIGMDKMKLRARQICYWPLMNQEIENFVKKCQTCEKFARKNVKEPLKPYCIPTRPWERISTDIFSYGNCVYLVVYDAYSNWLELVTLKNKSSSQVILKLKSIFAKFGCPDIMVCDNNPFTSFSMQQFAKNWNFKIVPRSPHFPQSNGLAEKGVDISKRMIKKAHEEGKDIFESLLNYRNTPLKFIDYSPSQLMMSRMCKTKLPISADLLNPKLCERVDDKLRYRSERNETYFNKGAKPLSDMNAGQNVTIFNHVNKNWEPGQIVSKHDSPRSYNVQINSGETVRRNRVDLRKSHNEFDIKQNCSDLPEMVDDDNSYSISNSGVDPVIGKRETIVKTRVGRVVKPIQRLNL
ncbi:uncharacterized protein K02A2.6-like [Photinus pyralis]|uniref:uncharacterized protein K02A2.6-like n=1 Tax=Photinus pyralis TaxID=7054 RepID=UPI001266F6C5|nr:uncharacterized protein K02A2.6-like [Photinus pyralis]